ncbi:demethoxyubiquinone hydroxylase family protein [Candidatus Woesearchaeota archaeon]|nr:demethoxyubiquinone hydroxylase family protein [Candidatus Woesearchaeota archaeon]
MLSDIPKNLSKVNPADLDKEILRVGIIAELDAVNLYEQMAAMAKDKNIKKMLLDIAKEEKTHVGEFQALLLNRDKQQVKELEAGKEEVKEEVGE